MWKTKREELKEKASCYATEKSKECNGKTCPYYYTCISYKRSLELGEIKDREDILNQMCH
jgi:hypothetical protein